MNRREFLKRIGIAGGALAAGAVVGNSEAPRVKAAPRAEAADSQGSVADRHGKQPSYEDTGERLFGNKDQAPKTGTTDSQGSVADRHGKQPSYEDTGERLFGNKD
jgi:hypothetical protein